MSVDGKRVWVTEYIQCTTECGLEAGDQSAARLAQLIIGYVGGCVHAEGSARELILYTLPLIHNLVSTLMLTRLWIDFMLLWKKKIGSRSLQACCCSRADT